jgi:hypothetical protein
MLELGEGCASNRGTTRCEGATSPFPEQKATSELGYQNHLTIRTRLGYGPIWTEFVAIQIIGTPFSI